MHSNEMQDNVQYRNGAFYETIKFHLKYTPKVANYVTVIQHFFVPLIS